MKFFVIKIVAVLILVAIGFLFGVYLAKVNNKRSESFHYSHITQKYFYEKNFNGIADCKDGYDESIRGIIVNHHLLASKLMAETFCFVASKKKMTVIVLSPNHFMIGRGLSTTGINSFYTPYGILETDKELIQKMSEDNMVTIDDDPFKLEHGVYNLTPFIKRTLPNARIVPIIIKDNITQKEKEILISYLSDLSEKYLIVASLDFSHYLINEEADKKDAQTLEIINNLEFEKVQTLNINNNPDNVDSKPVLEIILALMAKQKASFTLLGHSSSAKIFNNPNTAENTSYINGYFRRN